MTFSTEKVVDLIDLTCSKRPSDAPPRDPTQCVGPSELDPWKKTYKEKRKAGCLSYMFVCCVCLCETFSSRGDPGVDLSQTVVT
jgi:hypothetical protein